MKNILLISGSLRAESVNTALLKAFADQAPEDVSVTWADINLPLFNEELEADFPSAATTLREQIIAAEAIIISTPEYNRGMSGVLKNAIDWASRPYGENTWQGKRVLVAAASPGGISGALAVYQVKQSLLHLNAEVIGQPEFMVGGAYEKVTDGVLTDDKTKGFIHSAWEVVLA
ncbi:MAG: NAD(P)H-dependent oxidoreductase [Candidatus Paceibacterota bacterium]